MILQLFILPFLAELNNGNTIIQPLKARQIAAIHLDGRNPLVVKEGIKRLSQCFIAANEIKPRQPRFFNYNRNTQECTFIMLRNGGFGFWDGPASGEAATVYVDWRMWKPERLTKIEFVVGYDWKYYPGPNGTEVRLRLCSFQKICCLSNTKTVFGVGGSRYSMDLQPDDPCYQLLWDVNDPENKRQTVEIYQNGSKDLNLFSIILHLPHN